MPFTKQIELYFNSFMVRLKETPFHVQILKNKFQFLHGAIKSNHPECGNVLFLTFQFLHGAIKRFLNRFNSTFNIHFNSFMVRLKDEACALLLFRFRISIPSWCD